MCFEFSDTTADAFYEEFFTPLLQILYDRKILIPKKFVVGNKLKGEAQSFEYTNFEVFREQLSRLRSQTHQKGFELYGDMEILTALGAQIEFNAIQVSLEFTSYCVLFNVFLYSDVLLPLRLDGDYKRFWNIEVWRLNKNRLFNTLTEINQQDCWEDFTISPPDWWHGNVYTSGLHIFNLRDILEEEYAKNPPKEIFDIDNYFMELGVEAVPMEMLKKFYAGWYFESDQFSEDNVHALYEQLIIPCLRILYDRKIFIPREISMSYGPQGKRRNLEYKNFETFKEQLYQTRQEINDYGFEMLGDMGIFNASGLYAESYVMKVTLEFRPEPMLSIFLYSDALLPLRLDRYYHQHWNINVCKHNKNRLFDALTEINQLNYWNEDLSLSPPNWSHGNVYESGFHIFNLRSTLEREYAEQPPKEAFDIDAYFEEMGMDGNYP